MYCARQMAITSTARMPKKPGRASIPWHGAPARLSQDGSIRGVKILLGETVLLEFSFWSTAYSMVQSLGSSA